MRRATAPFLVLSLIVSCFLTPHARGDEPKSLFSAANALQAKLIVFLSGAAPQALTNDGIPGLVQMDAPPTWLAHWQDTLLAELRGNAQVHQHPLFRTRLQILPLQPPAGGYRVLTAAQVSAQALTCPKSAPLQLRIDVLNQGDASAQTWLGIDIACVDDGPVLQKQWRLLVATSPHGDVQRAFGVVWSRPVRLTSRPDAQATPEFVLHPTPLDRRFTWLVALPGGGWLAQLQSVRIGLWNAPDALPRFEDLEADDGTAPTAGDNIDAERFTLLLAEDCAPRALLLHGPVDADGRQPLWHEGAWDVALPTPDANAPPRTLVLQRIAKPNLHDNALGGRAWTHASYLLWQVTHEDVRSVELPLVPLDLEGIWDCDGEPPLQALTCGFRRLGPTSESTVETRRFELLPGPVAAFKLAPVKD